MSKRISFEASAEEKEAGPRRTEFFAARRTLQPTARPRASVLQTKAPEGSKRQSARSSVDVHAGGGDSMFGALRRGHAVNVGISSIMIEQDLVEVPMFKNCSASFISRLAQDASETTRAFGFGQSVHEVGDAGKSMVLVLRGSLVVKKKAEELLRLEQGSHYGETMLLSLEQVWRVSLVASASSMVCEIRRESFRRLLEDFPAEAQHFEMFFDIAMDRLFSGTRTHTCDIFTGLSSKMLEAFDEHMLRRVYFPGEIVVNDGPNSKELVLLQDGMAAVEIAGRTVRTEIRGTCGQKEAGRSRLRSDILSDDDEEEEEEDQRPACFGELEFLGLSPVRKTAVKALTPCVCRILNREMVLHVAKLTDMEVYSSMLMQMFQKTVHKHSGEQASVLVDFISAGCSSEFLQFLSDHLEARLYPEHKLIWELNKKSCSRSLQMVMSGSVRVAGVGKQDLPRLGKGDVFGRMSALSLRPRPAGASALYAAEHCCVEVLHQDVVVRALEIYHDQRGKVLSLDIEAKAAAGTSKPMDFVEIVASSRIFSDMSHAFVQELAASAIDRIFMPGDVVMHQGAVEFSMFILVSGTADVFVSDVSKSDEPFAAKDRLLRHAKSMSRVSHLSPGAICGELAMLGITPTRSATIKASALCIFWEVTQDKAMTILDRYPQERDLFGAVIVHNLDISVPGRLLQLPLLRSFDRKFRMLLTLYCERHAYFPDQQILKEGEAGDKCYIFNLGPAMLQKRGFTVKTFSPGSHFGCDHMLGINRLYCGSLIAMTVCHVLAVSRSSYLLALEQYPSQKASQQLLRQQRVEAKELRQAIQRITIRKSIWQRYQGEIQKEKNMFFLSEHDLAKRFMKAWSETAKELKATRFERHRRRREVEEMIENWKLKNEAGLKKAAYKKKEREILAKNILERGPLEYIEAPESSETHRLPRIPKKQTQELVSILKAWPSPRPSPHYQLKVWSVMSKELTEPPPGEAAGSRLLPMLQGVRKRGDGILQASGSDDEESEEADLNEDCDEVLDLGPARQVSTSGTSSVSVGVDKARRLSRLLCATQEVMDSRLG